MVGVIRALRLVDGQPVVIAAQAIAVRVRIRNKPPLQHLVRRVAHAGNDVARLEGCLLDFSEVILGVAVEGHLSDFNERVIAVRPDLGEIERVDVVGLRFSFGHDLHADSPLGEVAVLDRPEEVALRVVRIFAAHRIGFLAREVLDALLGLEVPFDIEQLVLVVDE